MTSEKTVEWLKAFSTWIAIATFILSAILSPLGLDNLTASYAFLAVAASFTIVALFTQRIPVLSKVVGSLLVVAITLGLGYFLWWLSQPRFEITALNTLEDDKNAYEVTDQLIWNQNNLDKYGVSITFMLEVRPNYFGKQRFGKVIAQISGDSGNTLEKTLWDDFTSSASTQEIQLTLPDLLSISDLQTNSNATHNPFRVGEIDYQQTTITVEIVRLADKLHPWAKEKIVIRDAPWDMRATLTERNNHREADVYVKNLGGTGEFSVRYRLVQLKNRLDTSTIPDNNGAITLNTWNEPTKLVRLEPGAFFTNTVAIPDQAEQGRYILEVYAVKKQNYIKFDDPASNWENLDSLQIPWWFGEYPSTRLIFVVPLPEIETVDIIQTEVDRLRNEEGIDLGLPVEPLEEITSPQGTVGQHQLFQDGEVYVNDGQAYALYDPILEHYKDLGGAQSIMLGLPISSIKVVTSSSGITGTMMKFEGPELEESKDEPAAICASEKGIAATWPWIGQVYSQDHGGHSGWLGFPLADEQHYGTNSTLQMFEYGYIVYHYPEVAAGEYDWSRPPVAYPYLASRGALFDVQAQQGWQNTGIQLQAGNRITVIQIDGSWSYVGEAFFDANGDPNADIEEEHREILILPSSYVGTLVGRIGENNDRIFPVGRWNEFTADTEGTLYLAMNDIDHQDNAGAITVQIMVESAATE
jgi:hypothetical protein